MTFLLWYFTQDDFVKFISGLSDRKGIFFPFRHSNIGRQLVSSIVNMICLSIFTNWDRLAMFYMVCVEHTFDMFSWFVALFGFFWLNIILRFFLSKINGHVQFCSNIRNGLHERDLQWFDVITTKSNLLTSSRAFIIHLDFWVNIWISEALNLYLKKRNFALVYHQNIE